MLQKIKTHKNKCHIRGKKHIKVSILRELQWKMLQYYLQVLKYISVCLESTENIF